MECKRFTTCFSFNGVLKGINDGNMSAKGIFEVRGRRTVEIQSLLSEIISGQLIQSQEWDEDLNCIRTDISALTDGRSNSRYENKPKSWVLSKPVIGEWETGIIENGVRAYNLESAVMSKCTILDYKLCDLPN